MGIFKDNPDELKIGDVYTFCCCHDAQVIETQDDVQEIIENWNDEDEELKYMVVSGENAWKICRDYDDEEKMRNCSRVKALQDNK